MTSLLILPNQLFDIKYFPKDNKINKVIIYEHPQYFTKYNFNKKKLLLHRASMKYYQDYLEDKKLKVKYVEFKDFIPKQKYIYFDTIDNIKIKNLDKDSIQLESPNFLHTKEDYAKYRKKSKNFTFYYFYMLNNYHYIL